MPKARQTCTRCSMRRQKCDKGQPCTRCIAAGEAKSCTRIWHGGYDANVHRQYPKAELKYRRRSSNMVPGHSRRDSGDTAHSLRSNNSLRPPSLESDSDGWSSESERRTETGGHGYETLFGDVYQLPDPLDSAMGADDSIIPAFRSAEHASHQIQPKYRKLCISEPEETPGTRLGRFRDQEFASLQECLPNVLRVLQLVDYHEEYLLWQTYCYHGPTFRRELVGAIQAGAGRIDLNHLDLRWCALLFAIMASSITCSSPSAMKEWEFGREQRLSLGKKWYEAASQCLYLGEDVSRPHINSVQATVVLAGPSHILGLSHRHFVTLGSAFKTAQGLGLPRLPQHLEGNYTGISEDIVISREVGRRTWWSLVAHDWMSIASYEMFGIDPSHVTTPRPHNYSADPNEGPDPLAEYQNICLDIATIMMEFHVASIATSESTVEYDHVWTHDQRLRDLARNELRPNDVTNPWNTWSRQLIRMKVAHGIINVHRNFFPRSFRESQYAWSRWASNEAAKTILHEAEAAHLDVERPAIWIDHAHVIVAGVTLGTDLLCRTANEPEREEHWGLVQKAHSLLSGHGDNVLASRGQKLLSELLQGATGGIPCQHSSIPSSWRSMIDPTPNAGTIDTLLNHVPTNPTAPSLGPLGFIGQPPQHHMTTQPPNIIIDPALESNSMPPFTTGPTALDLSSINITAPEATSWNDMLPPTFSHGRFSPSNVFGANEDVYPGANYW